MVQCFTKLVHSIVISPLGRLGRWRPWIPVRTLYSIFSFPFFLLTCTDYIFCTMLSPLFFSTRFLSVDFSLCCCILYGILYGAVFRQAEAFNGDLSAWEVGKVINMGYSTYTLFLSKIGPFFGWHYLYFWTMVSPLFQLIWTLFHFCFVIVVFNLANNFNGGVSTWDVGDVENMFAST